MRPILAFSSGPDPFEPWAAALRPLLPDVEILPADAIPASERVRYALVWNPPEGVFARWPGLRLVINLGAGVDRLVRRADLPDVPVTRISDPEMARMMAGWVLFAVLRHLRDIPVFEAAQRRRAWRYIHPRPTTERCVAVLGVGELGRRAAEEVARLGCETLGWSAREKDVPGVTMRHGPEALPRVLARADVVVSMLPLTPQTRGLIDADAFAAMRPGTAFVNASRGEVVDEAALIAALRSGHLSGATLDVFATEPLPADNPLWDLPGVLITPHLASVALPASAAPQIADNIHRLERGDALRNVVDRLRGY